MTHRDTDHVLADLEDTIQELQSAKQRDNQRRRNASITDHYGGPAELSDPGEFVGSLELSIPHGAFGDDRPVARRSDGETAPRFSDGVTITTPDGSDPDLLDANTQYRATVTVRNGGTFSAHTAPVELFVRHRPPDAMVDTNGGTLQLSKSTGQTISGVTTLPPGARIFGVGFDRGASTLSSDTIQFVGSWAVNDDRTWSISGDLSGVTGGDYTLRLYDAIDVPPQKAPQDTIVDAGAIGDTRLDGYPDFVLDEATVIGEVDGVYTDFPFNDPIDMALATDLATASFVGHQQIQHEPQSESQATVTFSTPPSRGNTVLTEVYARTYARSPPDLPADMSRLDHTQSRFVGHTERNWSR